LGVQSEQLLTERQAFEKEILSGAEHANYPADEVPEQADYNENPIALRISPLCKSFIS
jgi:hypothetical protein